LTLLLLSLSQVAGKGATTHVWSGAGGDSLFSNPANWSSGGAPAPGATVELLFPAAGTTQAIVNVPNLRADINVRRTPFLLSGVGDTTPLILESLMATNNINCTLGETLPITIDGFAGIGAWSNSTVRLNGRLQGTNGVVRFYSWGQSIIGGTQANTFTGDVEVRAVVRMGKPTGVNAFAGKVTVSNGGELHWNAGQQLPDNGLLQVSPTTSDIEPLHSAFAETIGTLRLSWGGGGSGAIQLEATNLNVGRLEVSYYNQLRSPTLTIREAITVTNYQNDGISLEAPLQLAGNVSVETDGFAVLFKGPISGPANAGLNLHGVIFGVWIPDWTAFTFEATNTYAGVTYVSTGAAEAFNPASFGLTNGGLVLGSNAVLRIQAPMTLAEPIAMVGKTNEPSFSIFTDIHAPMIELPDNVFQVTTLSGPLVVSNVVSLKSYNTNSQLILSGRVTGPGSLYSYVERLRFTGSISNSFSGGFHVGLGTTELQRTLGTHVLPGPVHIHEGGTLRCLGSHQIADTAAVKIDEGTLDLTVYSDTMASLEFRGGSVIGSGQLQVNDLIATRATNNLGGQASTITLSGLLAVDADGVLMDVEAGDADPELRINSTISSGLFGGWTKTGAGRLELWGTNSYLGGTFIQAGTVTMKSAGALGGGGGTAVSPGAVLEIATAANIPGEYLFLDGSTLRLLSPTTNIWGGGIDISGFARFEAAFSTGRLLLTNSIVGEGNLGKTGPGTLEIGGSATNGFIGYAYVGGGTLFLNKSVGPALTGEGVLVGLDPVTFTPAAGILHSARTAQIADFAAVGLTTVGTWNLNGFNDTIGSLQGSGVINLGAAQLTTGGLGVSTTFDGVITGNGSISLVKVGSGTFTLTGQNAYTGRTTVSGGTLLINGTNAPGLTTISGGTLGGRGQIGNVTAQGGSLSPGNSPGILRVGNFIGNPNVTYRCELNSTNAGTGHDQLSVTGWVQLGQSPLQLVLGNGGAVSNRYTILVNDGSEAITNTFAGLTEGATFHASGTPFRITYQGGTGNDVVLTQLGLQQKPQIGGVKKLPNGTIEITGTGIPDLLYSVFASTNVAESVTNWLDLGLIQASPAGALQFVDTDATNYTARFYQFVLPPFNQ
jgi:autotransporter-associated beta strand protein